MALCGRGGLEWGKAGWNWMEYSIVESGGVEWSEVE